MAKMLVVVQTGNAEETAKAIYDRLGSSELPKGVMPVHRTAWTIELPMCSEFFAKLLQSVRNVGRGYVVAEVVPGTVPICPFEET
jgi:hypothetical protein